MCTGTIFTVVYTHRYGVDLRPCATEKEAHKEAERIAADNTQEIVAEHGQPDWTNWLELTDGQEDIEISQDLLIRG